MAEVKKRTLRTKLETNLALPSTVTLETWRANATDIQVAIYDADGVAAITDIQSVNCKVQPSQLDDTTLMDSTVASASMDADLTAAEWVAGTDQHATFSFTNSETNLTLTLPSLNCWIVFTATLTGGEEVTLAAGTLTIHEDNNAAGDPPATNPGTAITIEEADARYLQSMGWEIKTDDFTAVNGGRYVLNNAAKAFIITLPDDVPAHTFEVVVAQWSSGSLIGGTTSGTLTSSTSNVITYNAAGAWVIRSVHIPDVYSRSNHTGTQPLSTISDAGTAAAVDVEDLPVSTAQQTALDTKAPLASPTLTGTPVAPTAAKGTDTAQLATTEFVNQNANTYGSAVLTASNAVQGWWVTPNVITFSDSYANASYIGFASRQGDFGVVRIDNTTGKHTRSVLGHATRDDHSVPSFAQLPDGRIIAAYAAHASETKVYTRTSRSSNLDDWSEEVEITTSGNATYACTRVVGDNLQLWYRTGTSSSGQWIMRYLSLLENNPLTATQWGSERTAYNSEYLAFYENSSSAGQWKTFNTQHPISGSDNNIYYTYIQLIGTVNKPGGANLGDVVTGSGLPITDTEGLKVVDAGTGTSTVRLLSAGENINNLPAVLYTRFTTDGGGSDGEYYMGNYNNSSSVFNELSLGSAGVPVDDPVTSFYFGGACFNPDDKNIVYLIRETSGTWTLEEITIAANLLSYVSVTLVSSSNKLLRPYYDNGRVFYSEFSAYVSYSSWTGDLKWIEV